MVNKDAELRLADQAAKTMMDELIQNAENTDKDYLEAMDKVAHIMAEYSLLKTEDENRTKAILRTTQLFQILLLHALNNTSSVLSAFEDLIEKVEKESNDKTTSN